MQSVNYYILKSAIIFPEAAFLGESGLDEKQVNIAQLVPQIVINESVDADVLSGHLVVYDGAGLLESYPLRGEERLSLEIQDAFGNVRLWDMMIYRIDNVVVDKVNKIVSYNLHFVTYQSFRAMCRTVTSAYKQKTISAIASEIFEDAYNPEGAPFATTTLATNTIGKNFDGTRKKLTLEPTEGFVRLCVPHMVTQAAMQFLCRRAFSATGAPSCSYRFFESSDEYVFVTDEFLFQRATSGVRPPYTMTFFDRIHRDGREFFFEMDNLEELNNFKRVDTLEDIHGGAYKNRVLEIDTVQRVANLNEAGYDYWANRNKYFSAASDDIVDRHTKSFMDYYSHTENSKRFQVVKDFEENADVASHQLSGERHYKDIVSNRTAFRQHLSSITVTAVGPPRLDVVVGDVIKLDVLEFTADNTGRTAQNPQLSGNYIVMALTRDFNKEEGRNQYTLCKMNWSQIREGSQSARRRFGDIVSRLTT